MCEIKVHSQAILRVVNPTEDAVTEDEFLEAEESHNEYGEGVALGETSSISDDQHRAAADHNASDPDVETDTKPKA